ncbi:MAG: S8 family serine peptidase [Anaerolineales bacterium]|nr:S8 family serine peptidase [Anaerolineales bacterium]
MKQKACEPFVWEKPNTTREYDLKLGQKLIDFNLILTGLPEDIEQVVNDIPNLPISEAPIQSIELSKYLKDDLCTAVPGLRVFQPLQIRLYEFNPVAESEEAIWTAITDIYQKAAELGKIVFADPNYITGDPEGGSGQSGQIQGGPEGGSGQSGQIQGGPEGGSGQSGQIQGGENGNTGGQPPEEAFIKHWAFYATKGIHLEAGTGIRINTKNKGQSADVYIFDTVDKRIHRDLNLIENGTDRPHYSPYVCIQRTHPQEPLEICISSPAERFQGTSRRHIQVRSTTARTVDEHGLFIAGLIHRIAPQCNLHLVDVLNQHGQGELFGFLYALMLLAKRGLGKAGARKPQPLNRAVVNLSLGVTLSRELMTKTGVPLALKAMQTGSLPMQSAQNYLLVRMLDDMLNTHQYVGSMRLVTKLLHELGAILVAAAGNDSAGITGDLPPQIPARYDEVISVAASIFNGKKANYSNRGDILAPGGGSDLLDVKPQHAQPDPNPQKDLRDYVMMSFVPRLSDQDSGLGMWSGTSFATPMVSGLMALMLEKMEVNNVTLTSADLKEILANRSRDGIIDVQMALDSIQDT